MPANNCVSVFGWARSIAVAIALTLLAGARFCAASEAYPTKPIRLVVPFAPGGTTDAIARVIAESSGTILGQPVIVENKPGAGGNVGTDLVAKAEADGYTIAMVGNSFAVNSALYRAMPYRQQDLVPVVMAGSVPFVLVSGSNAPFRSVAELLAYARGNPGKVTYASGGNGTIGHLGAHWLGALAKVQLQHIPYKGGSPALTDLVGGQVDIFFDTLITSSPFIRAGKIRPLLVSTRTRVEAMPSVPTATESGLPELTFSAWVGIVAPAKTPMPVLQRINVAVNRALALPEVQNKLAAIGAQPFGGSLSEARTFMDDETSRWGAVVRNSGAQVE